VQRALGLCAAAGGTRGVDGDSNAVLRTTPGLSWSDLAPHPYLVGEDKRTYVHVVPHLADDCAATVCAVLRHALLGGVVSGARASHVWHRTRLLGQLALDVAQGVGGAVAGRDLGFLQPAPGREALVVLDCGLEELDDLLVFDVVGSVAGDVKGRVAGRVLGKLVGPEVGVGSSLVDPVSVHPLDEIVGAKIFEESADIGALVGRDDGTVGQTGGGVGRGSGIVLTAQIAVLGVGAIAKVGPEACSVLLAAIAGWSWSAR
jgi:hypothetical protein